MRKLNAKMGKFGLKIQDPDLEHMLAKLRSCQVVIIGNRSDHLNSNSHKNILTGLLRTARTYRGLVFGYELILWR